MQLKAPMDLFRNLPNILSLARLCLVPLSVVFISEPSWIAAFIVFVIAGVTDALDGWLAKRYNLETELGAYLDPLADKALLVSIYIALTLNKEMPGALTILVVSRDIMIVSAVLIAFALEKRMQIRPLFVSKLNTTAQIALAGLVLGAKAFELNLGTLLPIAYVVVAFLTLASMAAYLLQWLRHMAH